jgi:hypothetical protein
MKEKNKFNRPKNYSPFKVYESPKKKTEIEA